MAAMRPIAVAPYRRRQGRCEVLFSRAGVDAAAGLDLALILGEALPRAPLHTEAQRLVAAVARTSGPVLKMPLGQIAAEGAAIKVFATEVMDGPEPDGVTLLWLPIEEAAGRIPVAVRGILATLPGRIRMTARRRVA